MNRTLLLVSLLVLAFMGLADSWYLFQSAVSDTALTCDIGAAFDGCNVVAQSPYSYIFGVPLALFGVAFYALIFVLVALVAVLPVRMLYRIVFLLTLAGVLASVVFVLIQVVLIKAICIYCMASAGITLLSFVSARSLLKRFAPPFLVSIPEA
jgi:uncharacterized membrane protein